MKASVLLTACWGTLLSSAVATAQGVSVENAKSELTRRPPLNSAEQLLTQSIVSIDWVEEPLEEIIDWLDEQGAQEVNIIPRWRYLSAEGIGPDTPVTLRLRHSTVGVILNEVLVQIAEPGALRMHGTRNRLVLSTAANFDSQLHTRVYEMTDLVFQIPDFGDSVPTIDMAGGLTGAPRFSGPVSRGSSGGEQAERMSNARLEEFRAAIEQTIDPDSWDHAQRTTAGGFREGRAVGRIRVLGRSLIITNTIEVHEKIAGRFGLKSRR